MIANAPVSRKTNDSLFEITKLNPSEIIKRLSNKETIGYIILGYHFELEINEKESLLDGISSIEISCKDSLFSGAKNICCFKKSPELHACTSKGFSCMCTGIDINDYNRREMIFTNSIVQLTFVESSTKPKQPRKLRK